MSAELGTEVCAAVLYREQAAKCAFSNFMLAHILVLTKSSPSVLVDLICYFTSAPCIPICFI